MTASDSTAPETVIATYRVQKSKEQAFLELLRKHHPVLVRLGLATEEEPVIYRGEEDGAPVFYEIFTWVDGMAPRTAHHTPDVAAVWEAMGTLVEERNGRPKFEFPHVEKLELAFSEA